MNFPCKLLPFLIIFTLSIPSTVPLSFNYSYFDANYAYNISYEGDAYPTNSGIQLTTNSLDINMQPSIGRVIYNTPFILWSNATNKLADFTTSFSFVINSKGNSSYSHGMTFFLAPIGFPLPTPRGYSLGLSPANHTSSSRSDSFVGVEFDTFVNDGLDPPYVHVGIDISSMNSTTTMPWCSSIENGSMNYAYVTYNSTTTSLSIEFSGFCEGNTYLVHEVDLRSILPEEVSVGFSAETGLLFETNTLYSWSFSSNFDENIAREDKRKHGRKVKLRYRGRVIIITVPSVSVAFVASVAFVGVMILVWLAIGWKNKNKEEKEEDKDDN